MCCVMTGGSWDGSCLALVVLCSGQSHGKFTQFSPPIILENQPLPLSLTIRWTFIPELSAHAYKAVAVVIVSRSSHKSCSTADRQACVLWGKYHLKNVYCLALKLCTTHAAAVLCDFNHCSSVEVRKVAMCTILTSRYHWFWRLTDEI